MNKNKYRAYYCCLGLIMSVFGCISCGGDPGVIVDIGSWPQNSVRLRIRAKLDGVIGTDQYIPQNQTRFVVYAPSGKSGLLSMQITALNSGDCNVASGQTQSEVARSLRSLREVRAVLDPINPVRCSLTLRVTEGSIESDLPNVGCSSTASPCDLSVEPGATVQLRATATSASKIPVWSGDCLGRSACTLELDRGRDVSVHWEERSCSPTGLCWYNPPQGTVATNLASNRRGDLWIGGVRGGLMQCNQGGCASIVSGSERTLSSLAVSETGEAWVLEGGGGLLRCTSGGCGQVPGVSAGEATQVTAGDGIAWIAGANGYLASCTATGCRSKSTGTTNSLYRVATGPMGITWAVGQAGRVVRCVEEACSHLPTLTSESLLSLAVGSDGTAVIGGAKGTVLRCQAAACTVEPPRPNPGNVVDVDTSESGETWLVDSMWNVSVCGTAGCVAVGNPILKPLTSVRAISATEAWIAGMDGTLARCTKSGCTAVPSKTTATITQLTFTNERVYGVDTSGGLLVCRGQNCSYTPGPYTADLAKISVNDKGDAWAVSPSGSALRCQGPSCSAVMIDSSRRLGQVAVDGSGVAWVSTTNTLPLSPGTAWRCSGKTCTSLSSLFSPPTYLWIASANTKGDAWFVGGSGYAAHCDVLGCGKVDVGVGTNVDLNSVKVTDKGDAWIAGNRRTIIRCQASGTGCVVLNSPDAPSPSDINLFGIGASEGGPVFFAGYQGTVRVCTGNSCPQIPGVDMTQVFGGAVGGAASDAWLWTGQNGYRLFFCTSAQCTQVASLPLLSQAARAKDAELWVVGNDLQRCDTTSCTPISRPGNVVLADVAARSSGDLWLCGPGGVVLRRAGTP